jgi:hypothetical protein
MTASRTKVTRSMTSRRGNAFDDSDEEGTDDEDVEDQTDAVASVKGPSAKLPPCSNSEHRQNGCVSS